MTIDQFIRYVYDLARKDGKGNVVSPAAIINWLTYVMLDDFNNLLTQALTLAEQKKVALANVIFDIKDLRQFVKTIQVIPSDNTILGIKQLRAALPADFKYELGCTCSTETLILNPNFDQLPAPVTYAGIKNVELLSSTLLPKYRGSVINDNPDESPKGFVGGGYIEFLPNDLYGIVLMYLRTPAKPYYDFCMDANDAEIFMPAGSVIHLDDSNNACLYDSDDNLLTSIVTKSGATIPYTSLTVDLDWDEINHVRFANTVAQKLGINLHNTILTQVQ